MATFDSKASTMTAGLDTEVGRMVVDKGLCTREEVETCRELQKQSSDPNGRSLASVLVENNFITSTQAQRTQKEIQASNKSQIPGYELISKLGAGAMATVYKARQLSLDRIVAIKVLPRKSSENPDFVDRFYKEGRAAAKLAHNNMVQAIDVGYSPKGYHYFVMEYIEGDTLYDWMVPTNMGGKGKKFTEAEALDIIIQICDALAHSHKRNLIHRDVKPKNIILTTSGVAKLTDLGLARDVGDKEAAEMEAGKAYGTPYYISPEQIRGDVDIDFRADIYSLGATMYHLVTGRPPFEGDSPSAVMHKHLKQPLVPADHLNTSLSNGIGEIIDVAMAKKREERYQSTLDMLADLRAVRNGEGPVHARRAVDLNSLDHVEESGETMDIVEQGPRPGFMARLFAPFASPLPLVLLIISILSIIGNVALAILFIMK